MSRRRAVPAAAAIAALLTASPILLGATAASAATKANFAGSATGTLLGTLAYRGAEHPYLVGNLADAAKRFGAGSAQANAAQAGLNTNDQALATLLSGGKTSVKNAMLGGIGLRDREEVSYAAAVATGATSKQRQAVDSQTNTAGTIAKSIHNAAPTVSVAKAKAAFVTLNKGDEAALKAGALGQASQFGLVEKASTASAAAMTVVGVAAAAQRGLTGIGTVIVNGATKVDVPVSVLYRAALEAAFTQHVYQTGLFGQAILLKGPRSAAAVAARKAENTNTALDAQLLGDLGTGTSHTRLVWNTHITGYGDYLTKLAAGNAVLAKPASTLLSSYENAITSLVKKAVPSLNTANLRGSYTEHVTGTLAVFRAEKAGSSTVYPMALMGAHHFSDLATTIAEGQTELTD